MENTNVYVVPTDGARGTERNRSVLSIVIPKQIQCLRFLQPMILIYLALNLSFLYVKSILRFLTLLGKLSLFHNIDHNFVLIFAFTVYVDFCNARVPTSSYCNRNCIPLFLSAVLFYIFKPV